jgi:hypothetical protein
MQTQGSICKLFLHQIFFNLLQQYIRFKEYLVYIKSHLRDKIFNMEIEQLIDTTLPNSTKSLAEEKLRRLIRISKVNILRYKSQITLLIIILFAFGNAYYLLAPDHSLFFKTPRKTYIFSKLHRPFGKIDIRKTALLSREELQSHILSSVPWYMKENASKYIAVILKMAEKYQIDPFWVTAVMWTESHFKQSAVSKVGAKGLMQIMPGTGEYLAKKIKSPHFSAVSTAQTGDAHVNIEMGVYYLDYLLRKFRGNYALATVAYNMGPYRVLKRLRNKQPVGVKNRYLSKVKLNYVLASKFFKREANKLTHPFERTYVYKYINGYLNRGIIIPRSLKKII